MRAALLAVLAAIVAITGFLWLRPSAPAPGAVTEPKAKINVAPEETAAQAPTPEPRKPGLRFPPKKDSPQANDNRFEAIEQLLEDGRADAAATALAEILKNDPNNERALLELGYLYSRDPKHGDAGVQMLEKALRLNPENDEAMGELILLAMEGRGGDIVAKVQAAYAQNPDSANLAAGLGRLKLNEGNLDEGVPLLEKASENPLVAEEAYHSLLDAYLMAGDKAKTVDTYQKLLEFQQRSLEQARRSGDPNAQRLERTMVQNQLGLAAELIEQRQFDQAETLLRQVRDLSPQERGLERLTKKLEDERSG